MDKVEYILDKFSFLREIQDEVKDKHIPIVLPEADIYDARGKLDKRMITAIDYLTSLGVVSPIFTGKGSLIKRNIKEANLENLLHPEIIDSSDSNTLTKYANIFRNRLEENNELFGSKKEIPSLDDTKDLLLQDKNMFGTSVLLDGKSDALLSGSCNETSKVLGALFKFS